MKVYHITGGKIAEKYNYSVYLSPTDGDYRKVRVSDATPDGGMNIYETTHTAGRHVIVDENVPTKAKIGGPVKSLLDCYPFVGCMAVSEKFKSIIEDVEPGVHQFLPLDAYRGGKVQGRLYWLVIGQRLDTVHDSMPRDARGWPITTRGPEFKIILI